MKEETRSRIFKINTFVSWLILAILLTLTIFQWHATLIVIALEVVNTPSLRPPGWSTDTVYILSRVLWLILGTVWLGIETFTFDFIIETKRPQILLQRVVRILIILGAAYSISYGILLFLA